MSKTTARGRSRTVLLVQSNEALRTASQEILEGFGHRVLSVPDPEAARELADRHGEAIDLTVVEAFPKRGTGLELVRALRQGRPGLRALLLTAFGEDPALREAILAGEVVALAVPFSAPDLRRGVASALAMPVPDATPEATPSGRRSRRRARVPVWTLAAAASLVGVVLLVPLLDRGGPPPLADRGASDVTRSLVILPVAPRGEVETAPRTLRWEPVLGAASYRVEIRTVDGRLLWEDRSVDPEIAVDPAAVPFAPAVRYSWRVEALDGPGRPIASSPRVWVLVRPSRASPQ
jgi:CheY-like chemotaxis protein